MTTQTSRLPSQENKNRGQHKKVCVAMVNEEGLGTIFGEFADEKEAEDFTKDFLKPSFPNEEFVALPLIMALRLADSGEYYVMDEDVFERKENE
jgi:hypothetical protein